MNLYHIKIYSLIYLLEKQADIFTDAAKNSLATLIDTLPDDIEAIANQIVSWYEDKPAIKQAFLSLAENGGEILAMGGQLLELTPQEYKETIKNAIRQEQPEKPAPHPQPPTA